MDNVREAVKRLELAVETASLIVGGWRGRPTPRLLNEAEIALSAADREIFVSWGAWDDANLRYQISMVAEIRREVALARETGKWVDSD